MRPHCACTQKQFAWGSGACSAARARDDVGIGFRVSGFGFRVEVPAQPVQRKHAPALRRPSRGSRAPCQLGPRVPVRGCRSLLWQVRIPESSQTLFTGHPRTEWTRFCTHLDSHTRTVCRSQPSPPNALMIRVWCCDTRHGQRERNGEQHPLNTRVPSWSSRSPSHWAGGPTQHGDQNQEDLPPINPQPPRPPHRSVLFCDFD